MPTRVVCRPCSQTDSPKQVPEDSGGRLTLGGRIVFIICILIIVIIVIIVISTYPISVKIHFAM